MKTPLNIWDLSIQQSKEKRDSSISKPDSQALERSLLVLGSKNVGKSTLIHRFLETQDSAKPTLALEYTFGRKTNNNLAKVSRNIRQLATLTYLQLDFTNFYPVQDVCHIWELGGGTLFTKLLETPLSPLKLTNLHIVLMIDLSKPGELWFTLETLMSALQTFSK